MPIKIHSQQVVDIVISSSEKVVAVSPALVGERIENASNKEIKELANLIKSLSEVKNIHYLDLHSVFEKALAKGNNSSYISTNPFRVMFDVFFYKNEARIDQLSTKRGLQLTLDGIHLNSAGAKIVANEYAQAITNTIAPGSDMEGS